MILRGTCGTDSKLATRIKEYQQYLMTRCYKLHKTNGQFSEVAKIPRKTAKQPSYQGLQSYLILNRIYQFVPDFSILIRKR